MACQGGYHLNAEYLTPWGEADDSKQEGEGTAGCRSEGVPLHEDHGNYKGPFLRMDGW